MKKFLNFLIAFTFILSFSSCNESSLSEQSNLLSLNFSSTENIIIAKGQEYNSLYLHADTENTDSYDAGNIILVVEDENICTAEFDETVLKTYFYINIKGISEGSTYIYAMTKDHSHLSERVKIKVTSSLESETQTETKDETETQIPVSDAVNIKVYSLSENVSRNEKATLIIKGLPETEYKISVYYSDYPSKASGLEPQISNKDGYINWTWKVGSNTKIGKHRIEVTDGKETLIIYFNVVN